jgi:hypothetical protein
MRKSIVTLGFLGTGRNYEDLHHAQYDLLCHAASCRFLMDYKLNMNYQTGPQTSTHLCMHTHKHVRAPPPTHAHTDKFAHEHTNTGRHTHTHLLCLVFVDVFTCE